MFTTENPSVCAGNMHFPSVSTVRSSIAVRPVPFLKLSLPLPLSLNSARITLFITDIFSENSSAPECLSVFVSVSTRFSFMQFHMRNVILSASPLISSVVLMLYFALYSPSISLSSLIPIVLLSGRSSRSACLISSTPLLRLSVTVVIHCSALSGFVLMFSFAASSRIMLPEMLCPSLSCILAENRLRSSTAADFFAVLAYSSRLAILRLRRTVSSLLSASCSRHLISCPAVIWADSECHEHYNKYQHINKRRFYYEKEQAVPKRRRYVGNTFPHRIYLRHRLRQSTARISDCRCI